LLRKPRLTQGCSAERMEDGLVILSILYRVNLKMEYTGFGSWFYIGT
jgi:hypothetical protein